MAGTDAGSFVYDGNWKRVKQIFDGRTIYSIYDRSGAILTRDDATVSEKTDFITLGGQTFVRVANGTPSYPLNDYLGSAYMVADQSGGGTAANTYNFTPFGEGIGNDPGTQNKQGYTFAVADKAEQMSSGDSSASVDREGFELTLPGELASQKVEFSCTGAMQTSGGC